jgi:hypothetical protein
MQETKKEGSWFPASKKCQNMQETRELSHETQRQQIFVPKIMKSTTREGRLPRRQLFVPKIMKSTRKEGRLPNDN